MYKRMIWCAYLGDRRLWCSWVSTSWWQRLKSSMSYMNKNACTNPWKSNEYLKQSGSQFTSIPSKTSQTSSQGMSKTSCDMLQKLQELNTKTSNSLSGCKVFLSPQRGIQESKSIIRRSSFVSWISVIYLDVPYHLRAGVRTHRSLHNNARQEWPRLSSYYPAVQFLR